MDLLSGLGLGARTGDGVPHLVESADAGSDGARLGGGGDRLVDHPRKPCGVVELTAQLLQERHGGRGHDHPTPAACGAVQHRPHQAQAGPLAGQPADHLVRRRVSPKVRSIRLVWRILGQCSRGKRRNVVSSGKLASRQATAAG